MAILSNINNAQTRRDQQLNLEDGRLLINEKSHFMPSPNEELATRLLAAPNSMDTSNHLFPKALTKSVSTLNPIPDTTPPIPQSVSPQIGDNHVALNASISASFNEKIQAGNGIITLTNGHGDSRSINVHDPQVIFSGNTITLKPDYDLWPNSQYSVLVEFGAIVDQANNPFTGTQDPSAYTFSTEAVIPKFTSIQYDEVSKGFNIYFNQTVQTGNGYLILTNHQGDERRIAIHDQNQIFVARDFIFIHPQTELLAGSQYFLEFDNNAILDTAGHPITLPKSSDLSITPPTPPPLPIPISSLPKHDAQAVFLDSNIRINLNEITLPGTGHFILSNGLEDTRYIAANDNSQVTFLTGDIFHDGISEYESGGKSIIINLKDDLLPNCQYYLGMEDNTILDKNGHAATAVPLANGLHFSTYDNQAPILVYLTPQNNAQQVPINARIEADFNEPIKAGTGNFILSNNLGDSRTIAVNDTSQVFISSNYISISPVQKLQTNAQYNLQFNAGIVTDLSNHGILSSYDSQGITFSTSDIDTTPKLDTQNPKFIQGDFLQSDEYYDLQDAYYLSLQFDEPIKLASGNIVLRNSANENYQFSVTDDNTPVNFNLHDDKILNIVNTFSFKFQKNTHYDVFIDNGAITDLAGNPFINDASKPIFSFDTINDITPPSVVNAPDTYFLANRIRLKFNEVIERGSGNITLSNAAGDQRVIPVTDKEQVFIESPNTLIISPSQKLQPNSHYTISLDAGVVQDYFQNANLATQAIEYYSRLAPDTATNNPVTEINRGGVQGMYDNLDLLVLHFNQPVQWHGGFSLSQHSIGEHDFVLSPDGLSLSVELDNHSTITHGDSIFLTGIDANGFFDQYVTFSL